MKRQWIMLISLSLLFMVTFARADTYKFDPEHTSVNWKISHLGFSNYLGKWAANGTLYLDKKSPENSKVNVTIAIDSLVTGNPELNKVLLSPDFFDVKKYPTATYVSQKVEVTGKKSAKVFGTLTMHGVSQPVVLNVVLNQIADNPFVKKEDAGFSATTTIKRSDFGIKAYLPDLGDTITLDIEAEGSKVDEPDMSSKK